MHPKGQQGKIVNLQKDGWASVRFTSDPVRSNTMTCGWCGRKSKTLYHYAEWPPNIPRPVQPGRVWFCNLRCFYHKEPALGY